MSKSISIRGNKDVEDIDELLMFVEALQITDELYRLMQGPERISRLRIDFRTKVFKELTGARLESFRVSSPPEVTIVVDNLWLGAFAFSLTNYKLVKENVAEIVSDAKKFLEGIEGLTKQEVEDIELGIKLILDQLLAGAEKETKGFLNKIQKARSRLNFSIVETVELNDDDT